ncbi:MAG: hypothetical protein DWQ31_08360 [Planctomycetota bacterium]|nr:MAG: hypothetical protein DWQ31_08360 [Planctomycetota bacterium]REJ93959.1 MAG: hypothetical protein DWQ35_09315 [Planctomycetota bacterium]REK30939.1 MAG: hypothetical protein DWQ42_01140 [Planctomycetota bacterium]REK38191.1 MAG: hypothetical protein DWQ46_20875 [Planctomycetota bacterium]
MKPVDDEHVNAILPFLPPPIVAMIKLQRLRIGGDLWHDAWSFPLKYGIWAWLAILDEASLLK